MAEELFCHYQFLSHHLIDDQILYFRPFIQMISDDQFI